MWLQCLQAWIVPQQFILVCSTYWATTGLVFFPFLLLHFLISLVLSFYVVLSVFFWVDTGFPLWCVYIEQCSSRGCLPCKASTARRVLSLLPTHHDGCGRWRRWCAKHRWRGRRWHLLHLLQLWFRCNIPAMPSQVLLWLHKQASPEQPEVLLLQCSSNISYKDSRFVSDDALTATFGVMVRRKLVTLTSLSILFDGRCRWLGGLSFAFPGLPLCERWETVPLFPL
jgi:hypothetical protein